MPDFIILSDLTLTTIAFLLIIWKTAILLISLGHFIDYSPGTGYIGTENSFYDYSISAIGEEISDEKIIAALSAAALSEIQVGKLLNLYAFAEGLPNNAIEDFTERCDDQIRYWDQRRWLLLYGRCPPVMFVPTIKVTILKCRQEH